MWKETLRERKKVEKKEGQMNNNNLERDIERKKGRRRME